MALQKINWTQIDTLHVPTGSTVDIGQFGTGTSVNSVHTNELSIVGVDFFDYLNAIGYTGHTPNTITVEDNAGLSVTREPSGTTLATTYNTTLDPTLSTPSTVGGIVAGTTVSQLSGKTFVEFVDELLFPIVLPTYTIPTITMSGISSGIAEIGSTLSPTISVYGIKNDAGAFTQLRIIRNGTPILTDNSFTVSAESSIPSQFGYSDPNNPNYRYTIPAPYSTPYVIPYSSYPVSTIYYADGNYGIGMAKQDNKGNVDSRSFAVRSVNAPQSASTLFASSSATITGIFPYFWGTSTVIPTTASIAAAIAGNTANKVLLSASGTLSIPYNISGEFIWFAYFNSYATKTIWYVTALDTGDIDGSFISTVATQPVNSPDGFWTGLNFKMHWSVYATIQNTIEFRNS